MGRYRKSVRLYRHIKALGKRHAMIRVLAAAFTAVFMASACSGGGTSSSPRATRSPAAAATAASSATTSPGPASGSPPPPASVSGSPSAPSPSQAAASQYLADLNSVSGSGDLFTGSAEVNGRYFANSVYLSNPPGNVSYNIGRQWKDLEATVGLSDDSPENEKVQFQILADQRSIYNHVFVLGQSQQINLDVTGVLRLELIATLVSPYVGQTEAVWGNAEVIG